MVACSTHSSLKLATMGWNDFFRCILISIQLWFQKIHFHSSSRYYMKSKVMWWEIFYGKGIEIRAGFGLIGSAEKKIWADYEQLLRVVFSCFQGQKKCNLKKKKIVASPLKSCIKWSFKKNLFFLQNLKNIFFSKPGE